jgi:thymidylate synthase (FAD)
MSLVHPIWVTPAAENLIARIARVSNPANQDNPDSQGLIRYMIRHQHWSPFEMVSACLEINTTRDIGRQILRHRSFSFQEFSQRYASVENFHELELRECRLQDNQNRQNSLEGAPVVVQASWAILPEGLTPTRMYMAGTLRSWIHYCQLRTGPETQKEHREVAQACSNVLQDYFPGVWEAAGLGGYTQSPK